MDVPSILSREKVRRLDSLLKQMTAAIESARVNIRACVPQLSLCDVPVEVILSIFQLACTDCLSVVNISLVCKSFRHIVLLSSQLWAGCPLTLRTPPQIIDMIASRAGSAGLVVKFEMSHRESTFPPMDAASKVFEHSAKWKELSSSLDVRATELYSRFPNPDVSALVILKVKKLAQSRAAPQHSFYQDWSLPALRTLTDETWLPPPSFAARQIPNLTLCDLSPKPSDLPRVILFANAAPRLKNLRLRMQGSEDVAMDILTQCAKFNPPALVNLLVLFPESLPSSAVQHILPVLLCAGLTELAFACNNYDKEATDGSIVACKRVFKSLRRLCPSLETIALCMTGRAGKEKLYFIDDMLQHLPSTIKNIQLIILADVRLLSHDQDSSSDVPESSHPSLSSLQIDHQGPLTENFFRQVAEQFKLRKIKLRTVTERNIGFLEYAKTMKTLNIFREAGVLCDGRT